MQYINQKCCLIVHHFHNMKNAILSCFSSYSFTTNGCINEVFTEIPSPISSNLFSDDGSLCFYGDFSSSRDLFDLQNTTDSILVSESTSVCQMNHMPVQEDIFYQPWNTTYIQQSDNDIRLIQETRKRSAEASDAATSSLVNSETSERDKKKRPMRFQKKLPKIHKEKEPTARRRTQKLTDKITALQKLVSPYGKTDTASVLLEASISIQALQDQIEEMFHYISGEQTTNMTGEERHDLDSRGMCLVPSVILEELDRRFPQHVCLQR